MRAECTKTKYASQGMADFDIKKISKKSNRAIIPIRSYLCSICGSWHLTSRKDFNVEIKLLNDQVLDLKRENEALRKVNELLRENKNKLQNHEAKVDERVQKIKQELNIMERRYINSKKENSELIAKIIQLQK